MKITLSKEALGKLPAPDSQGLIRVQATLSIGQDGTADLMDINGTPVGEDDESSETSPDSEGTPATPDDSNPMPSTPSMSGAPSGLY